VHAVRHGMLLVQNLRQLLAGEALEPYVPNPKALLLLTCGARYAIAARGDWSAEGRLAWWWKNAIDRRWMRRLNATRI
jgi:selenide,water dikinase